MAYIDLKNCSFRIQDGSTNRCTIVVGDGTLTWEESRPLEYLKDRGIIDTVRLGEQEPVKVSFNFRWKYIRGNADGSTVSIEDAITRRNSASAWVSSDSDACTPYSVDLYIINTPTCTSDTTEQVILKYFRYNTLQHDPKAGTISCEGTCNIAAPTVNRGTQYS